MALWRIAWAQPCWDKLNIIWTNTVIEICIDSYTKPSAESRDWKEGGGIVMFALGKGFTYGGSKQSYKQWDDKDDKVYSNLVLSKTHEEQVQCRYGNNITLWFSTEKKQNKLKIFKAAVFFNNLNAQPDCSRKVHASVDLFHGKLNCILHLLKTVSKYLKKYFMRLFQLVFLFRIKKKPWNSGILLFEFSIMLHITDTYVYISRHPQILHNITPRNEFLWFMPLNG